MYIRDEMPPLPPHAPIVLYFGNKCNKLHMHTLVVFSIIILFIYSIETVIQSFVFLS